MNRKSRQIAIATALQNAAENDDLVVVPSLHDFEATIKTRVRDNVKEDVSKGESLKALLRKWGLKDVMVDDQMTQARCLVIVQALPPKLYLSSIHLDHVAVDDIKDIKLTNILKADKIFVEAPAFKYIQRMYKDLNYITKLRQIEDHFAPRTKDFVPYDADGQAAFADLDGEKAWPHGVNIDMVLGKEEVPEKREWHGMMKKKDTARAVWRARMVKAAMKVQRGGRPKEEVPFTSDGGEGELDVVESQE